MDIAVEQRARRSTGVPFIVGVTGHRDLRDEDLPHLRGAIMEFVHRMRERLPNTELRIAVGMAEGADLLVAQTALEMGVPVNAVLPMPLAEYAADFDARALELLESLLRHPEVECAELASGSREASYANLMETLIRRTSLLLAVWDGQSSPLAGGTADTVLRYLGVRTGSETVDSRLELVATEGDLDSAGPMVYWIPARRRDDEHWPERRRACFLGGLGDRGLQVLSAVPPRLTNQLAELNDYNREIERLRDHRGPRPLDSLLATLPESLPLHDRAVLTQIDAVYGGADALAVHYQRRSDRLFKFFSLTTFGMAMAYLAYERISHTDVLLYAYLLILLSGLGLYLLLHGRRWFARHLMYRVLAETMRVKFFLHLSGADHLVDAQEVLSLSGIDRFHGFGWIGYVLRSVAPVRPNAAQSSALEASSVERAWIQGQERYFVAKVTRLERNSRRIGRLKQALFVVIVLVLLTLVAFGDFTHHAHIGAVTLKNLLMFCMGLVAVSFGVWELHQNKMATRELLWQYGNQLSHFSRARMQLAHTTAWGRRREIVAELGKDSLMESYLWTIHRYHREHEPPATT